MIYLYLDESGDLGFDFINKKPSRFFVVTILAVQGEDARRRITIGVKRTLRRKLNPASKRQRMVEELKGTDTTFEVKQYFLRQIKDAKFSIYSIVLNKKRVYEYLLKDKSRVYNWVARLLLDNVNISGAQTRVMLVLDKCKGKREIEDFNTYIRSQLQARINPKIPLDIRHLDSLQECCLQACDMFAWGIFRKYERRDNKWWNVFKEKVVYDGTYLPENKNERAL
ncbi:MAG: DUF3800 domain-containing protein [Elusimicrobia bacterium]|nr:DUF3800 domain-containing protein [Candidatus Liberimonas magnetica]